MSAASATAGDAVQTVGGTVRLVWDWADVGLHVLGLVALATFVVLLVRSGQWRDPLVHVRPAAGSIPGWLAPGVVFVFLVLQLAVAVAIRIASGPEPPETGSVGWHMAHAADMASRLVVSAAIAVLLLWRCGFESRLRPSPGGKLVAAGAGFVAVLALVTLQLLFVLHVWSRLWPELPTPDHVVLEAFRNDPAPPWGALHLALSAIVLAPLVEELFFRGLLLGALISAMDRVWVPVILTSVLFGLVHSSNPHSILPLVTMGIVLAYLRLRTGSLAVCFVVHALFNLRTIVATLLGVG